MPFNIKSLEEYFTKERAKVLSPVSIEVKLSEFIGSSLSLNSMTLKSEYVTHFCRLYPLHANNLIGEEFRKRVEENHEETIQDLTKIMSLLIGNGYKLKVNYRLERKDKKT